MSGTLLTYVKKTYIYFLSNLVISVTNIYWFIFFLHPIRHILAGLFILEGGLCTAMLYNRGAHTSYRPNIMLEKCRYFQPEFWFFFFCFWWFKRWGKTLSLTSFFKLIILCTASVSMICRIDQARIIAQVLVVERLLGEGMAHFFSWAGKNAHNARDYHPV